MGLFPIRKGDTWQQKATWRHVVLRGLRSGRCGGEGRIPRLIPHPLMRFWSWLKPSLLALRPILAAYRANPRALAFGVACWLLFSGVREFSPPAARITLGAIFLIGLLWPDARKKGEK